MGLSFSFLTSTPPSDPGLGDLPDDCLASVMKYLDPPQICQLAMLSNSFNRASSADFVWESKLPLNYLDVIHRVFDKDDVLSKDLCNKEIYSRLSTPTSFDGGSKKVWLDKKTTKTCTLISTHGLAITGIDDRRQWNHIPTEDSRFQSVAYLRNTWWFEVKGEIEFPFPVGSYSLFFRLQLGRTEKSFGRRVCNPEHIHGWDKKPVQFQLSTSDGQQATKQYYLKEQGKWISYHAGDFVVKHDDTKSSKSIGVKFSMTQIDLQHTKGGVCVDSVLICPSECTRKVVLS